MSNIGGSARQGFPIRVIDVTLTYRERGSQVQALKRASLEAMPGEITVVVGPSGSGKTTLLRLIAGFLRPDSGDVEYEGIGRLSSMKPGEVRRLRRVMGISFQEPILVSSLTVIDNIEFSIEAGGEKPSRYRDRILRLADKLAIRKLLGRLPRHISGGEARRAHLLMALAHDPAILLLDEPTAYLDEESTKRVIELLMEEKGRGKTVIVSTHDPALESVADRVYRIKYGVIK